MKKRQLNAINHGQVRLFLESPQLRAPRPLMHPHLAHAYCAKRKRIVSFRRGYPRGPGSICHFTRADPRPPRGTEIPSRATSTSIVMVIMEIIGPMEHKLLGMLIEPLDYAECLQCPQANNDIMQTMPIISVNEKIAISTCLCLILIATEPNDDFVSRRVATASCRPCHAAE
jgi:hypothetical protein